MSAPEPNQETNENDPDSQPQSNNETLASPNNDAFIGPQANLEYFKTIPAILKMISVVTGLFAFCLIAHGYNNAKLFSQTYPILSCDGPDSCRFENKYEDQLCREDETRKVCVNRMLIIPFLYIIAFTWTGTLIVLIALLLVDLSKIKGFSQADLIGHLVAAFLVIVSGLCVISYFIQVLAEDACSDENIREGLAILFPDKGMSSKSFGRGRSPFPHFITITTNSTDHHESRQSSSQDSLFSYFKQICPEETRDFYYHWHFVSGGIFAIITGILYIVIAVFFMRARRPVGPMAQG